MGSLKNQKHSFFGVAAEDEGIRLDRWFHRHMPHVTQGQLQKHLRQGDVRVNGQKGQASDRVQAGQQISVFEGLLMPPEKKPLLSPSPHLIREADALQQALLYQDHDILILNKPPGLATQGGTKLTLHVAQLIALWTPSIPHIVHRLDRQTSGVLIIALHPQAAAFLGEAFRARKITKIYWALVVGQPPHLEGEIALPLQKRPGRQGEKMEIDADGKEAITHYRVIASDPKGAWSWLELSPHTGRTHQLRVHCAALGCPILGDGKYGGKQAFPFGRTPLHLHARAVYFPHPCGKQQAAEAPLPVHMQETWKQLGLKEESNA